jgi:hypothetical protein
MQSIQDELDKFFLSYDKILMRLNILKLKTKTGNEITHKDLRKAIVVMQKKHSNCRWKSEKLKSKKYYILIEGYYWLIYVYFQNEKNLLDADINFFIKRIELYEKRLELDSKSLFNNDIAYSQLENYFNRKIDTIRKAIQKLERKYNINLKFLNGNQLYVYSKGIELLCKECFKQKYLELLEQYKMELTEQYIKAGYIYDNFFYLN